MESVEDTPIFTERCTDTHGLEDEPVLEDLHAMLQVSQTFNSCEEAFDAYKLYARLRGFAVRIQRCYRKNGEAGEIVKRDFVCHRGNTPNTTKIDTQDNSQRRNRNSCRCNCQATLRVSLVNIDGGDKWHVIRFEDEHNHDMLTQNEVRHLRCHRFISEHCKNRIWDLAQCNVSVRQILTILAAEQKVDPASLPFNAKDVHNFISSMRRKNRTEDASKLLLTCLSLQRSDPDFKFEYEVDDENRLMHVAWSHATSFRAYQNYGDVVLFDTTYKLNVYDMPVGIWVGVSNFGSSCFFACCLLRDEKSASFEWAFKAFLKLMDGKAPVSIMTDQDLAMKDAIRVVFPATKHGLCMWHIAKKFPSYMRSILKERYDEWKESFWSLTRVETTEEFESGWQIHIEEFGLEMNDHMSDLYEQREKWATPYTMAHFFAGLSTTGRSEAMNATLKRFVKKQVNLSDFMSQVTGVVGMMDYNGEFLLTKQNVDNIKLMTPHPIEKQAADLLTPYAFAKYQTEIVSSFSYAAFIVDIPQGIWLVRQMGKSTGGRTVFHLTTNSIKCSCKMFEYEGILCRHAVAVLNRCNAFETPKDYIAFRWTRSASVRLPQMGSGVEQGRARLEMLQFVTSELVKEATTSQEKHNWITHKLSKILQEARGYMHFGFGASQSSTNQTPAMHNIELPLTLNGNSAVFPIITPPTSNPKGRKKTKRIRGVLENNQRTRKCRVPGCGSTSHDRRNCPLMQQGIGSNVVTKQSVPQNASDLFEDMGTPNQDSLDEVSIGEDY